MAEEAQPLDAAPIAEARPADAPSAPAPVAVRFDRTDGIGLCFTWLIAFIGYWYTLAPNVTLEWSGMLSASAYYAGASPPPGYPVWTIYSWVFANLIPFSNIAWRVALGSAVATAIACGLTSMMVSFGAKAIFATVPKFAVLGVQQQNRTRLVCGCVAGVVLAFSGGIWGNAVIASTRSMTVLLFAGVLCLTTRWFFEPARKRYLAGAFLLFGMLLTNDQNFIIVLPLLVGAVMLVRASVGRDLAIFVLPLGGFLATWYTQVGVWVEIRSTRGGAHWELDLPVAIGFAGVITLGIILVALTLRIGTERRFVLACGLCFLLGFAFYLFLPISSMTNPPVNWGYPRTADGFWHLIGQGQYERVIPTASVADYYSQLKDLATVTNRQFGMFYVILILPILLFVSRLDWRARKWLTALLIVYVSVGPLLMALLNPPSYSYVVDLISDRLAPSFIILAVFFGLGLVSLAIQFAGRTKEAVTEAASTADTTSFSPSQATRPVL